VDELESKEAMAVHAYLHRKEGAASNAVTVREGRAHVSSAALEAEWEALVKGCWAVVSDQLSVVSETVGGDLGFPGQRGRVG